MSLFTFHGYTLIYSTRGNAQPKGLFFFSLFQFWLKFGSSRLSLTLGATGLFMRGFRFRSSRHLWLWSSAKDVSAWCKHRSIKNPMTFLIE